MRRFQLRAPVKSPTKWHHDTYSDEQNRTHVHGFLIFYRVCLQVEYKKTKQNMYNTVLAFQKKNFDDLVTIVILANVSCFRGATVNLNEKLPIL